MSTDPDFTQFVTDFFHVWYILCKITTGEKIEIKGRGKKLKGHECPTGKKNCECKIAFFSVRGGTNNMNTEELA